MWGQLLDGSQVVVAEPPTGTAPMNPAVSEKQMGVYVYPDGERHVLKIQNGLVQGGAESEDMVRVVEQFLTLRGVM